MSPRIGIWHPGVSSNHGDRAIQLATIDLIHNRYPTAEIIQYHRDIEEANAVYKGEPVAAELLGHLGMPRRKSLQSLDLLVWGGGSLVQQSSLFYFPRHATPALVASRAGTPVVCFGSGVEPLANAGLRLLARYLFDSVLTASFVRGRRSAQLLQSYGVKSPVPAATDPAISLRSAPAREAASHLMRAVNVDIETTRIVTVTVKPSFIYRGGLLPVAIELPGRDQRDRARRRDRFELAFAELIDHIVSTTGALVVMVPMFLSQGDLDVAERVADRVALADRVLVLSDLPTSRVLKALFGLAEVHVGVRLHSCILATSAGVPTLGVPYMVKTREYFEALQLAEYTVEEEDVTAHSLISTFSELWDGRKRIRAHLADRMPQLVQELEIQADNVLSSVLGAVR